MFLVGSVGIVLGITGIEDDSNSGSVLIGTDEGISENLEKTVDISFVFKIESGLFLNISWKVVSNKRSKDILVNKLKYYIRI
jgi:hypothetical protein